MRFKIIFYGKDAISIFPKKMGDDIQFNVWERPDLHKVIDIDLPVPITISKEAKRYFKFEEGDERC